MPVLALLLCCVSCSSGAPSQQGATTTTAPPEAVETTLASAVVANLQKGDGVDLHPTDTTAADCPDAGCAQSVTTDSFRIMSFSTTGRAQRYAGTHDSRQIEALVVTFSPNVSAQQRDALWAKITRMVR
ncbi:hypothetical protein Mycch_0702 [Mycolicibacterium chubuense NBB4]|uniref:Uncharacterized protein n=2 Tax=Mycolicibacterium chubuense TaxID=1800 RepID=I4BE13_MYCCN|nr:hypothetical protein Mycch_0702 [Mycolicibacterium chubuense NBB4]